MARSFLLQLTTWAFLAAFILSRSAHAKSLVQKKRRPDNGRELLGAMSAARDFEVLLSQSQDLINTNRLNEPSNSRGTYAHH